MRQLQVLSESSQCPRRKFGAMILDVERNAVVADGYNGAPRGAAGSLCKGTWCERDGLKREAIRGETWGEGDLTMIVHGDTELDVFTGEWLRATNELRAERGEPPLLHENVVDSRISDFLRKYPPIPSGTRLERGCHHAEANAICNAAAAGVATKGKHLLVTGEPCLMCAKLLHHAGIEKVWYVEGGYLGGSDGLEYLSAQGIQVESVPGLADPRANSNSSSLV
jgi:deoxycytidylate deaminase